MGILDSFRSLGSKVNKQDSEVEETGEGVISDLLPELELPMSDEDIIKLTRKWESKWDSSKVKQEWLDKCDESERYYLGKQYGKDSQDSRPLVDNLVFEALETFLPQATRRNPEPMVEVSNKQDEQNPQAAEYAKQIQSELANWADIVKLRMKIKKAARLWSIYLIAVVKFGWNIDENRPAATLVRPRKMIFDPDGTIEEEGYTGEFLGEYRKMKASILAMIIPTKKAYIEELVKGEMGTEVQFIEWWTTEYTCWTIKDEVLLKKKNPNWNYDQEKQTTQVDEYGNETPITQSIPGYNHFITPKIPYTFLSIFSLSKQPVDETSLIIQNLSNQDLINKRLKQIDTNADSMNNGMVVSEERSGLRKEEAGQVATALKKGKTVVIPNGAPRDAVDRFPANPLPADIYQQLQDTRVRFRDTFGVRGSSPAGIQNEDTVRGKVIVKGLDTDRIGGGVTEYLEQLADDIYNWIVQLLYVYDERYLGMEHPKIRVSVKEGSLLPKDSTTLANQAIELATAGFLDPISLFEKLEFPNPKETAKRLFLWQQSPQMLFQDDPDIQNLIAQQQQEAQLKAQQDAQQQAAQGEQQAKLAEQQHKQMMQAKIIDNNAKMASQTSRAGSDELLGQVKVQR